jgi:hypothetical protein
MEVSGSFMPQPLYPQGNSPQYPLDQRLGGPHGWSEHGGGQNPIIAPTGTEHQSSNPSLVPIWLSYSGSSELI